MTDDVTDAGVDLDLAMSWRVGAPARWNPFVEAWSFEVDRATDAEPSSRGDTTTEGRTVSGVRSVGAIGADLVVADDGSETGTRLDRVGSCGSPRRLERCWDPTRAAPALRWAESDTIEAARCIEPTEPWRKLSFAR